ncbi:hypothetical protein [Bradyrhizobium sp. B120]|uniref:hypothetical protein n=1 Tax=Bradyrhizobium sp. B120 TaxID=3410088 RepID=UPI003B97E4B3
MCKGHNEVIVEYALRDTSKPMASRTAAKMPGARTDPCSLINIKPRDHATCASLYGVAFRCMKQNAVPTLSNLLQTTSTSGGSQT